MAIPQFNLQIVATVKKDIGEDPVVLLDSNVDLAMPLALGGFGTWQYRQVQVPAAAVDQAILFTDAVALVVFSDLPISIKTKSGETACLKQRAHVWCADGISNPVSPAAGILVSNPGASAATVDVLVIEKS